MPDIFYIFRRSLSIAVTRTLAHFHSCHQSPLPLHMYVHFSSVCQKENGLGVGWGGESTKGGGEVQKLRAHGTAVSHREHSVCFSRGINICSNAGPPGSLMVRVSSEPESVGSCCRMAQR